MKKLRKVNLFIVAMVLAAGVIISRPSYATISGTNSLVSYDSTNTYPVGGSYAAISDDGNSVTYLSNGTLWQRNLLTNTTARVDQSTAGVGGNHNVSSPNNFNLLAVSETGRYITFADYATNLIDGQSITDGMSHVYLRDIVLGTTTLIDTTSSGTIGNNDALAGGVSDDGRFVVFMSHATNLGGGSTGLTYLYMKDMSTNTLKVLSHSASGVNANNAIGNVTVSCDGSFVAFQSTATNLTPSNNGHVSTYLVDLRNGFTITNLTLAANNTTYPITMSCNGRYISLASTATNLTSDSVSGTTTHIFRYDRLTGQYALVDQSSSSYISNGGGYAEYAGRTVSNNGTVLFTTADKNVVSPMATSYNEVYLRTPELGTTELVAINSSGQEGSPSPTAIHTMSISADGKNIVHTSIATNLIPGITTVGSGGDGNVVLSRVQ